jgi:hypothetical protein
MEEPFRGWKSRVENSRSIQTKEKTLNRKLLGVLLAGCILVTVFPGKVPGLHHDEAWMFLRVKDISRGMRPAFGMTDYTGALLHYVLWPVFGLFGYSDTLLRILAGLINVGALFLAVRVFQALSGRNRFGGWFGWLLCTFPAFVMYSRYPIEVTVLGPCFCFAGLLLLIKARSTSGKGEKRGIVLAILGGMFLGLNMYNHIIAATIPFSLFLSLFLVYRSAFLRSRLTWFSLLGIFLGYLPRIVLFFVYPRTGEPASGDLFAFASKDWAFLPRVLSGMWDGRLLYQRFVGENFLPVVPYISFVFLGILLARLALARRIPFTKLDRSVLLCWVTLILAITMISNHLSLRYFIMPVYLVPFLIAWLAAPFLDRLEANGIRRWIPFVLGGVVLLNCCYLGSNYYYAFLRSGGTISYFRLGKNFIEKSNHFLRTDRLYDQLTAKGIRIVFTEGFIEKPLAAYDVEKSALKFINTDYHKRIPGHPVLWKEKSAIVCYNLSADSITGKEFAGPLKKPEFVGRVPRYELDPSFDPHFLVWVAETKY